MKKRLLATLMSVVLTAGLLAGCGSAASTTEPDAATPAPAPSEAAEPASEEPVVEVPLQEEEPAPAEETAPAAELVTLNFPCIWVGTDSKAEVFGQMIQGFNTEYAGQYEIKIEDQTDYDAYRDKIRTQIATGAAPDIFSIDNMADLQLFASSGKLMDITAFLGGDINGRFAAGQIDSTKVDGANYAVPFEMAIIPIMGNKRLFDAAGVTMPTSYEELWTASDSLEANGVFPIPQMTADNAWTSMLWYSYALAAVGGPDVYERGLEDPAFVTAAELLLKEFDYTSSDAIGADASVVNGHFFNERTALYSNGTWILGRIKNEGVAGLFDNLVVSPGFSYEGQNGGSYVTSVQAFIALGKQDDPAKQAAAEAFIEYVTESSRLTELANSSGALFAVNMDTAAISDPTLAAIIEQHANATFTIGTFNFVMPTTVANAFPAAVEAMVLGDTTPEQFVAELIAARDQ